jgi:hypothetical protein
VPSTGEPLTVGSLVGAGATEVSVAVDVLVLAGVVVVSVGASVVVLSVAPVVSVAITANALVDVASPGTGEDTSIRAGVLVRLAAAIDTTATAPMITTTPRTKRRRLPGRPIRRL